ncbi:MAG: DUF6316 family protein [Pseudomonadales bacterium]
MRKSDPNQQKSFFRSVDRFFQANGQWYFSAREGDIGPFRSREQALREAKAYIEARMSSPRSDKSRGFFPTGDDRQIPAFLARSILSMEQPVERDLHLVLELEALG